MTSAVTLYTNPYSRGRIARWMLEEIGQPYDLVVLDYGTTMKAADYLAINPMGKVPAIRHGGVIVTEAAAICAYLADAFPAAGLAPALTDPARGDYYRWLFFAAGPLEQATTNHYAKFDPAPEQARMFGYGSYAQTIDTLEKKFAASDYVAGNRFTAADVYVGMAVGWGLEFGTIDKRPAFEAYWNRLKTRPACVAANAKDDALAAASKG